MNIKSFCLLESDPLKMQKSGYSNKFAKKTIRDRLFLFKNVKYGYQKLVIYPVLCKLVKNWGIESIGKILHSEVKFPKNTKKWLF